MRRVINPRGINATKNNRSAASSREGLRMTVVKNTLAKRARSDGQVKGLALLTAPAP
jgi:ribosomal protein L10